MMFKGTKVLGVTDYEADAAIDRQIDALMDQIYRERFWKPGGGDTDKIARLQKQVDELVAAEKKYVIKDELWELYMKNGGTGLNASTSNETTGYYVTLPTNKVELQMLLESDRMINANFRSPMTTLGHFVMLEMQGKPMDYYKTYRDKIRLVTKEWVLEVAKKYVRPEKAAIMIVGDWEPCNTGGDQFPGPLDKLGKVHRVSLTDPMTGEELKGR
jgi:predicted Zn-dependent peptidase